MNQECAGVSPAPERPDRRERRKGAMIAAARDLFLERGFDAVSLGEIVRRSGGSLSTLYALFDNKSGLLRAVVRSEQFSKLGRIRSIAESGLPPRETLKTIACTLHEQFLDQEKLALFRLVMAESVRNAEFARGMYEDVHVPFTAVIADLFARWDREGVGRIPNPWLTALFFIGMVLHPTQTRGLWGDFSVITPEQREAGAEEAARLFLLGYGLRDHDD